MDEYKRCKCLVGGLGADDDTIWLDCSNGLLGEPLGDAKASQLLKWFVDNPVISPLRWVYLGNNLLTKIPDEFAQLNTHPLSTVYIHDNNIDTIQSGAFNFSMVPLKELFLAKQKYSGVSSILPGAFNG